MPRGAVKCYNPRWTTNSEGICLERVRRSGTKAGGAKGIRLTFLEKNSTKKILKTPVVPAVNAADYVLHIPREYAVP